MTLNPAIVCFYSYRFTNFRRYRLLLLLSFYKGFDFKDGLPLKPDYGVFYHPSYGVMPWGLSPRHPSRTRPGIGVMQSVNQPRIVHSSLQPPVFTACFLFRTLIFEVHTQHGTGMDGGTVSESQQGRHIGVVSSMESSLPSLRCGLWILLTGRNHSRQR